MEPPVCYTCSAPISARYLLFRSLLEWYKISNPDTENHDLREIFDALMIDKICCRMRFTTIMCDRDYFQTRY